MNFASFPKKEIFKINFLILKHLELRLSVTIHDTENNSILDKTIGRAFIIHFLRYEALFSVIWFDYYIKNYLIIIKY